MLMTDAKQPGRSPSSDELMEFPEIDPNLLEQVVVILVQGTNLFGDKVYSYVEMTMSKMREMAEKIGRNENFKPSDFGRVISAGRGDPPENVRKEMEDEHKLVDVPNAKESFDARHRGGTVAQPNFMDDDDAS